MEYAKYSCDNCGEKFIIEGNAVVSDVLYLCNTCNHGKSTEKVEKSMSKREINEQLFKLIVKICVENDNYVLGLHFGMLLEENCKLDVKYLQRFVQLMLDKGLLMLQTSDDADYISLTKLGCEKYRSLKATCEVCGEHEADSGLHGFCSSCAEAEIAEQQL